MAASKSVPRLLQQQPHREGDDEAWREQQEAGTRDFQSTPPGGGWPPSGSGRAWPGQAATKGDRRNQVEAPKPSREREVGDLEQSEREIHGRARTPPRPGR